MRTFRGIVPLALCFPGVLSANVIFPAFSASYVAPMLFPPALVVVLALETAVLRLRWPAVGAWRAAGLICYVNAISWLVGVFITGYAFPSGYTFESVGHMRRDANFTLYMCLGFLIAYMLSVAIEGALLVSWARKYGCGNPFKVALIGNTFSYTFLAAGSILYMSAQRPNYAFKPIAEQALRSNQIIVPQRLNAALGIRMTLVRKLLAFTVAPLAALVPVLVLFGAQDVSVAVGLLFHPELLMFVLIPSYLSMALLGLPSIWLLRTFGRLNAWTVGLSGSLLGAASMHFFFRGFGFEAINDFGKIHVLLGAGSGLVVALSYWFLSGMTRQERAGVSRGAAA